MKLSTRIAAQFVFGFLLLSSGLAQDAKYTADMDRFSVRGLKTGISLEEADKAAAAAGMSTQYPYPKPEAYPLGPFITETYKNNKEGSEQMSADLSFTTQVPGSAAPKLWQIQYVSGFGDGVDMQKILADLKAKYGPMVPSRDGNPLAWSSDLKGKSPDDCVVVYIHIFPPHQQLGAAVIDEGRVSIVIANKPLAVKAQKDLDLSLQKAEQDRKKDTTQPKY